MAADQLVEAAPQGRATSSGPASRSGGGHVVGRRCPGSSWSRNHSRCWAKERGRSAGRRRRAEASERRLRDGGASGTRRARPAIARRGRRGAATVGASKSGSKRQLGPEGVAQPGDELGGQQRVAAQLEEVVVDADLRRRRAAPARWRRSPARASAGRRHVGGARGRAADAAPGRGGAAASGRRTPRPWRPGRRSRLRGRGLDPVALALEGIGRQRHRRRRSPAWNAAQSTVDPGQPEPAEGARAGRPASGCAVLRVAAARRRPRSPARRGCWRARVRQGAARARPPAAAASGSAQQRRERRRRSAPAARRWRAQ